MFFEKYKTEEEKINAVTQDGGAIQYIYNPSEEVQLAAVKQNGYAIKYIHNPGEEVVRYIIENCDDIEVVQLMRIDFDKLPDDLKLMLELKF